MVGLQFKWIDDPIIYTVTEVNPQNIVFEWFDGYLERNTFNIETLNTYLRDKDIIIVKNVYKIYELW